MQTGFLYIPDISGESRAADHEDDIDILSIEWNISQSQAVSTGRSRSRAISSPIALTKLYDAASPYIALACMQGKSFDEVVIAFRKDSGEAHLDYLKITLSNVVISSYALAGEGDCDSIEDQLELSFEKIKVVYTVQADDHSAGDEHEIEYDVVAGV